MDAFAQPKTVKKAIGSTARKATGDLAGFTSKPLTDVTPKAVTRHYKPRARKCANKACGKLFTPRAKHGRFCSDNCRKAEHRQRVAKTRKVKQVDPILVLTTCEYCNVSFFAEAGKGAKFCSPSHRTAAYRQRREAAIAALTGDLGSMTEQEAADLIETVGMTKISRYLRQSGYAYNENQRAWMTSDNAFVPSQ